MLADLIAEYIKEKTELDKAKGDCNGSWGYYLHDQIKTVKELSEQIDAEIRRIAGTVMPIYGKERK